MLPVLLYGVEFWTLTNLQLKGGSVRDVDVQVLSENIMNGAYY